MHDAAAGGSRAAPKTRGSGPPPLRAFLHARPLGLCRGRHLREGRDRTACGGMKRRIAIVAPIAVRYDAISAAAADNFRLLQAEPGWQVDFLTSHNELHLPARILQGISDLLSDDIFRSADVIIYHFG